MTYLFMLRRALSFGLIFAFLLNTFGPISLAHADSISSNFLPKPGVMVHLSQPTNPPLLKGIKVHPDNPFRLDFILDHEHCSDDKCPNLREESIRLIKYFLASITTPETDLWVNLSPYEKDRIVPTSFGQTEMGRDLLAQDYLLKQVTASLIYPEDELGKKFWKRIYEEAQAKYGTTNIPVNTFNKVWIVPDKAVVYENSRVNRVGWKGKNEPGIDGPGHTAYVVESRLKVMLEVDYLSLEKNIVGAGPRPASFAKGANQREGAGLEPARTDVNQLGSQIVREIVIPALTKEVNEGANFAQLRQVYNSLILATWYKKKIKDSILAKVYADKNKIEGLGYRGKGEGVRGKKDVLDDGPSNQLTPYPLPLTPEQIYTQYLTAFKKGVYNYIKEEPDPLTQQTIPKKYFSGGWVGFTLNQAMTVTQKMDPAQLSGDFLQISTNLTPQRQTAEFDQAMIINRTKPQSPEGDIYRFGWVKKLTSKEAEDQAREIERYQGVKNAVDPKILSSLDVFLKVSPEYEEQGEGKVIYEMFVRPSSQRLMKESHFYKGHVTLIFKEGKLTGWDNLIVSASHKEVDSWLEEFLESKLKEVNKFNYYLTEKARLNREDAWLKRERVFKKSDLVHSHPFEFDQRALDIAFRFFSLGQNQEGLAKELSGIKGIEKVQWTNEVVSILSKTEFVVIHRKDVNINERLGLKDRIYVSPDFGRDDVFAVKIYKRDARDGRKIDGPVYILGIVRSFHDSTAVLLKDGKIIGAIEEERLERNKHAFKYFPHEAVKYLLTTHQVSWDDIAHIAVNYDYNFFAETPHSPAPFHKFYADMGRLEPNEDQERYNPDLFEQYLSDLAKSRASEYVPPVTFVKHHKAHAASAWYTSPFDKSKPTLILSVDGKGEDETVTAWLGDKDTLKLIDRSLHPNSLGRLYHVTGKYIGYGKFGDEGTVMGLAPFGYPENPEELERVNRLRALFDELVRFDEKTGQLIIKEEYNNFATANYEDKGFSRVFLEKLGRLVPPLGADKGGTKIDPKKPENRPYINLAYVLQERVEQVVVQMVKHYLHSNPKTSAADQLIMVGGFALNISTNGKIVYSGVVAEDKFFVPAFPADDGTPIGAALSVAQEEYGINPLQRIDHISLGKTYADSEIKGALDRFGLVEGKDYRRLETDEQLVTETAGLLVEGKTVAWFQGGAELGPRALGNRSTLHLLTDPEGNKKMNVIKRREWWRPSALSITEEAAPEFLENIATSPFMTIALRVREDKKHLILSGMHAYERDGTTRPQTVSKVANPLYWSLLNKVGETTGVPGLINTSFNRREPIVETPEEALNTLYYSESIDSMAIGHFIVYKNADLQPSIISAADEPSLEALFVKATSAVSSSQDWDVFWAAVDALVQQRNNPNQSFIRFYSISDGKKELLLTVPLLKDLFPKESREQFIDDISRRLQSEVSTTTSVAIESTAPNYQSVIFNLFDSFIPEDLRGKISFVRDSAMAAKGFIKPPLYNRDGPRRAALAAALVLALGSITYVMLDNATQPQISTDLPSTASAQVRQESSNQREGINNPTDSEELNKERYSKEDLHAWLGLSQEERERIEKEVQSKYLWQVLKHMANNNWNRRTTAKEIDDLLRKELDSEFNQKYSGSFVNIILSGWGHRSPGLANLIDMQIGSKYEDEKDMSQFLSGVKRMYSILDVENPERMDYITFSTLLSLSSRLSSDQQLMDVQDGLEQLLGSDMISKIGMASNVSYISDYVSDLDQLPKRLEKLEDFFPKGSRELLRILGNPETFNNLSQENIDLSALIAGEDPTDFMISYEKLVKDFPRTRPRSIDVLVNPEKFKLLRDLYTFTGGGSDFRRLVDDVVKQYPYQYPENVLVDMQRLRSQGMSEPEIVNAIGKRELEITLQHQEEDRKREKSDQAMGTPLASPKGGIDFNSDKMDLQTRNEGDEIQFNLNSTQLQQLQNAPGFVPVIINIQPVIDLRAFLGLSEKAGNGLSNG